MNTKKYSPRAIAAVIFLFWMIPSFYARAATLYFKESDVSMHVGDTFETTLYFSADDESINALEGTITFPAGALALSEIRDGDSILTFWIEKPDFGSAAGGSFKFSGIIPGGFSRQDGRVFSLVLTARQQGGSAMLLTDAHAYRNDATGSQTELTVGSFRVDTTGSVQAPVTVPEIKDKEQPETFVPEIASDSNIFDGKEFMIFDTVDKHSGIDHYEVLETRMKSRFFAIFSRWHEAKSPYLLADQSRSSYLFVKAVDRDGNTRIERIIPAHPPAWYKNPNIYTLIVVIAACTAFISIMRRKIIQYVKKKFFGYHDATQ